MAEKCSASRDVTIVTMSVRAMLVLKHIQSSVVMQAAVTLRLIAMQEAIVIITHNSIIDYALFVSAR
jgi:hypothetical protein